MWVYCKSKGRESNEQTVQIWCWAEFWHHIKWSVRLEIKDNIFLIYIIYGRWYGHERADFCSGKWRAGIILVLIFYFRVRFPSCVVMKLLTHWRTRRCVISCLRMRTPGSLLGMFRLWLGHLNSLLKAVKCKEEKSAVCTWKGRAPWERKGEKRWVYQLSSAVLLLS